MNYFYLVIDSLRIKLDYLTIKRFKNKHDFPESLRLHGKPILSEQKNSKLILGENITMCSKSEFTALGVNHPVVIRLLTNNARIQIGNNTGISGGSFCAANSITIGENCLFGANVIVSDTDFHVINSKNRRNPTNWDMVGSSPIKIENNVFIGANSIILKGVSIGNNSVVGAGSVVSKDIAPNQIWAGNPARFIKPIEFIDRYTIA